MRQKPVPRDSSNQYVRKRTPYRSCTSKSLRCASAISAAVSPERSCRSRKIGIGSTLSNSSKYGLKSALSLKFPKGQSLRPDVSSGSEATALAPGCKLPVCSCEPTCSGTSPSEAMGHKPLFRPAAAVSYSEAKQAAHPRVAQRVCARPPLLWSGLAGHRRGAWQDEAASSGDRSVAAMSEVRGDFTRSV